MSLSVLWIAVGILSMSSLTRAQVNHILAKIGDDITLPFEHFRRCSGAMRLCRLPLTENGFAHDDVKQCWSERCQVISACDRRSVFLPSDEFKGRWGFKGDNPESLNSDLIFNITAGDAGIYQLCSSWTDAAEVAMLIIREKPSDPYISTSKPPLLDRSYTLTCVAESMSIPVNHGLKMNYQWKQNGKTLAHTQDMHFNGPDLIIKTLKLEHDTLQFTCRAREQDGHWTKESPRSAVYVEYGPELIDMVVTEDDNEHIQLSCSADCRPACSLVFENGNDHVNERNKVTLDFDTSPEIGSVYNCSASNVHGILTQTFEFYKNQNAPIIVDLTANGDEGHTIEIRQNESLSLTCIVIGRPEPTVTWLFSQENLNQSRKVVKTSYFNPANIANIATDVRHRYNSVFNIPRAECHHTGKYHCLAENTLGTDSQAHFLDVTVKCVPHVVNFPLTRVHLGQPLELELTVMSYMRPSVTCSRLPDNTANYRPCTLNVTMTTDLNRPILHQVIIHKEVTKPDNIGFYVISFTNDEGTLDEEFHLIPEADSSETGDRALYVILTGTIVGVVSLVCVAMVVVMYVRRHRRQPAQDDSFYEDGPSKYNSTGSLATQDSIITFNMSRASSGFVSCSDASKSPSVVRLLRNMEVTDA